MDKVTFIGKLRYSLSALPAKERQDILCDFEQHFIDGVNAGKSQEEVAAMLGNPREIALQFVDTLPPKDSVTAKGVGRGILATVGLLLFDLILALPIIASLIAVWVSLWAVVLALFVSGLACFAAPFLIISGFAVIPSIFAGLSLLGLSGLSGIGMYYVSKYFFIGLKGYGTAHYRIIKGGIDG